MRKLFYYYSFLFVLGGVGYCCLELIWRGFTDITMGFAGGISFCLIALIQKHLKPLNFIYRCILSGLSISAVELIFGLVFNLKLQMKIWDYSIMPFNILGQVCPQFLGIWCLISGVALLLSKLIEKELLNKKQIFH